MMAFAFKMINEILEAYPNNIKTLVEYLRIKISLRSNKFKL